MTSRIPTDMVADRTSKAKLSDTLGSMQTSINTNTSSLAESVNDLQVRSINAKYPPVPMVGAVGDGFTDDTTALQNIINYCQNNNYNLFIPPSFVGQKFYKITASLSLSKDITVFGIRGNGGNQTESAIRNTNPANDIFTVTSNVWEIKNLTFGHCAGVAGQVVSTTSNSITFDRLSDTYMTTMNAEQLVANVTPVTYSQMYTNAGNIYLALNSGANVGATLPTHTSGTVTLNGIQWQFIKVGTTFTEGQFGWNLQWRYSGVSGNTLTGVRPAPGMSVHVPSDFTPSSAGGTGPMPSLEENSVNTNAGACINAVNGNDPRIIGNWFNLISGSAVKRSDSVQGGIWYDNVLDGGQYGIYGNIHSALLLGNRFYGATKGGMYVTNGATASIVGNFFDNCSVGIEFYNTAMLETDKESAIQHILLTNNTFTSTTKNPIKARGLSNSLISNNKLGRTGDHAIYLINSSRCQFKDNTIDGVGDFYYSNTSAYVYFEGFNVDHSFDGNTGKYINVSQKCDYVFKFATGQNGYYQRSRYRNNDFNLTGATSYVGMCNAVELDTLDFNVFSGVKDSIAITTHSLAPRQNKQIRRYNGSVSSQVVVTLLRGSVYATQGDFFILEFNINTNGYGIVIQQEGDTSILWSDYSSGAINAKLLVYYTGSVWKVTVWQSLWNPSSAPPSLGTYNVNDTYTNSIPSEQGTAGSKYIIKGWRCIASGTFFANLSGVTATTTASSNTITVNTLSTLCLGQYISITGVAGVFQVINISGTTITLNTTVPTTVTNAAVAYSPPTFVQERTLTGN